MDGGKIIEKKILPEYFEAVDKRIKTFELRKDDSDYQVGDILKLNEWDGEKYTGRSLSKQITYVLRDCPEYGLQPGYCILAIQNTKLNPKFPYRIEKAHLYIFFLQLKGILTNKEADKAFKRLTKIPGSVYYGREFENASCFETQETI